MPQPRSCRIRSLAAAVPMTALLVGMPLAARAQTSTLPPTDIANQKPQAPSAASPSVAMPPPGAPAPLPAEAPAAPLMVPAPIVSPPGPVLVPAVVTSSDEPLAGFSDGTAFLRSPDNGFILFPNGRLQVDSYMYGYTKNKYTDKIPNNSFLLRRARLEVGGWIGGFVYFSLGGDFAQGPPAGAAPVAPANIATTDDFVALAPWKNLAILQVGQFDAPFTLENRTSDKYFDFMERSITVRAFGISDNKEMGAMVHGFNDDKNFYYSLGVFNGDGQNFKNADRQYDWMGRAWVAPLSFTGDGPLHDVEIGGSFWTGDRSNTLAPASQSTQAGFTFWNAGSFGFTPVGGTAQTIQLRQVGRLKAFAGELNAPIAHRYGVRGELVWRDSPLSADTIASSGVGTIVGGAELKGYSMYGELWAWVMGDDRIIGDQQGLEPFARYKKFGVKPVQDGLMLAFRVEHLDEDLTADPSVQGLGGILGPSNGTKTKVDSYELGVNYWHSKRFRATLNGIVNHFGGDTALVRGLASKYENELTLRLAVAL